MRLHGITRRAHLDAAPGPHDGVAGRPHEDLAAYLHGITRRAHLDVAAGPHDDAAGRPHDDLTVPPTIVPGAATSAPPLAPTMA